MSKPVLWQDVPEGFDPRLVSDSVNAIDLFIAGAPSEIQNWDGGTDGIWGDGELNWVNVGEPGKVESAGNIVVFNDTNTTVNVKGSQNVKGLQFTQEDIVIRS